MTLKPIGRMFVTERRFRVELGHLSIDRCGHDLEPVRASFCGDEPLFLCSAGVGMKTHHVESTGEADILFFFHWSSFW